MRARRTVQRLFDEPVRTNALPLMREDFCVQCGKALYFSPEPR
jgi:hypothetical protein